MGSSATTPLEVTTATLITLAVSPSNPTIVKGSSQAFAARGTYSDGTVQDLTGEVDWAVELPDAPVKDTFPLPSILEAIWGTGPSDISIVNGP
jgi:hypothetical protein